MNDGKAPVFLDIGAHIGVFSLTVLELFPDALVFAYEPAPSSFPFLVQNIELNGAQERVRAEREAVTDRNGTVDLFTDDSASSVSSLGLPRPGHRKAPVRSVAFDDIVRRCPQQIDFMKIDCEGGEYDIILGASPDSWQGVRYLALEYHPLPGHSWEELDHRLSEFGFVRSEHRPLGHNWGYAGYTK
jgi:FkbM family methyltransferase